MCFSAEVDLLAGLVVGALAVDAARHVRSKAEWPLAALPAVFSVHQLGESLVWWGIDGAAGAAWWRGAVLFYLLIGFGVLPVLVPVAVRALEPADRRRVLTPFVAVGAVVSAVLLGALARGPVTAEVVGRHISYDVDVWFGSVVVAGYVVATCGSLLAASSTPLRWYGVINLVVVAGLALADRTAFISLWCVWAAVTSVAISIHLRHGARTGLRQLA